MSDTLRSYGWSEEFESRLAELGLPDAAAGRVVETARGRMLLQTTAGPREATPAGRLFRDGGSALRPVVGDWVAFSTSTDGAGVVVSDVLGRRNQLSRKVAGARSDEQVVAANIDLVLVVMGLDGDFSPRRLERFLALAAASRVEAAVLLNKADVCTDLEAKLAAVRPLTSAPIAIVSALEGDLSAVELLVAPRRTAVLVGSSGVGKSTLINRLLGESVLRTAAVRASDSRGRHTTSHRELFRLPGGGLIIDNPGVREVQLWAEGERALDSVFDDIEVLAAGCRFTDCSHLDEPGCAVREAIERGELDETRLESLRKLESEVEALERRKDERARREHDRRLGKLYRSVQRAKRGHWGSR